MAIVKGKNGQLYEKQPNGQYRNVTGAVAQKMKEDREQHDKYSTSSAGDEISLVFMFFRYLITFNMIFVVYFAKNEYGTFAPMTIAMFVISVTYFTFWLSRRGLFGKKTAIRIVVVISLIAEIIFIPSVLFTIGLFSGEMLFAILMLLITAAAAYFLFFSQPIEESISDHD